MKENKKKLLTKYQVTLGFVFLTCGCLIYLLFRSKSINIYQWCNAFGLSEMIDSLRFAVSTLVISEWVRFSLPDGLYCASYILIIDAIWKNDYRLIKYIIISLVPLVTINSEILQYFGLVKGTFDMNDLICYTVPSTAYLIYSFYSIKYNKFKIQRL